MSKTAENGFLPEMTAEQIAEISTKAARHHSATLQQFFGDNVEDQVEDLAQSFALGCLEAAAKAEDGKAVRSYQWKYGNGYMLKRLHQMLSDMDAARVPIDTTGGAFTKDEDEDATGYVPDSAEDCALDFLANDDAKKAARKALESLPQELKEVVELHVIEEKTFREIGIILGIGSMLSWQRYQRGLKMLQSAYKAA